MRIAVVVPPEESVPPVTYGGTELVAYNLVEQLVTLGHHVTLVGTGDSHTSAQLAPAIQRSLRQSGASFAKHREHFHYVYMGSVLDILTTSGFDIIHNHLGWRLLPFTGLLPAPVITTLHGPLNVEDQQLFYKPFASANYVSISKNQRKGMPELNFVANVYNGIQLNKFSVGTGSRDYLVFLGRFSPEKGPVLAIQIAKKSGVPLKMAGKIDPVDADYFKRHVKPLIDGKFIQFVGEVNHTQKVALLSGACALLSPVQWEEPFGLVNAEAMACGTPVIATRRGSLPELIKSGTVGFICDTVESMIQAVAKVHTIKASDCRRHAENNFSASCMAQGYLAAYETVIHKTKHRGRPQSRATRNGSGI